MAVNKNIVEKIKKLFALAADKANENESNVALERAHALMREHGVAEVDLATGSVGQIEVDGWATEYLNQIDSYTRILASATAELFNCEFWLLRPGKVMNYKVKACFAGEQTDLELCKEIWPYLVKTAKRMATNYAGSGWSPRHRTFAEAFATRVYNRAKQMAIDEAEKPLNGQFTSDDAKYALVVAKKEDAIQQWFDKNKINLKITNRALRGKYDYSAAVAGGNAGDNISLNFRKQVGSNTPQQLLS